MTTTLEALAEQRWLDDLIAYGWPPGTMLDVDVDARGYARDDYRYPFVLSARTGDPPGDGFARFGVTTWMRGSVDGPTFLRARAMEDVLARELAELRAWHLLHMSVVRPLWWLDT